MLTYESACPLLGGTHTPVCSLHVGLITSARHNSARSDVQCAECVLMFVHSASKGEGRIVQK